MNNFSREILIEKRKWLRIAFFFFFDALFISSAVFLAFLLRFEGNIPLGHLLNLSSLIVLALIVSLPIFYFFKLYSFTWIYVSTRELVSLAKAVFLSFLLAAVAVFILRDSHFFTGLPRSTIFIAYFLIFILSGGIRFTKRIYMQTFPRIVKSGKDRTLIVGAGDAGEQILRSILSFKSSPYLPVGFADDSSAKQGILIHGVKVLGKIEDISRLIEKHKAEGLIIALPSAGSLAIKRAVEQGRKAGLRKIKVVPPIEEVISGQVGISNLREVEMEDLLGREPVGLDKKLVEEFIRSKKVLVTGAAGSIGSELCRQIIKFEPESIFLLDQDETGVFNIMEELSPKFPRLFPFVTNIRDKERVESCLGQAGPDIVFHAAAYKHVPLMEQFPEEAVKNNIVGTENLALAAQKNNVEKFIFVSTDKAVNPSSVMGASKRAGEMICQSLSQEGPTKYVSVRFGNVLDSRGSVIPIFREQIKRGGPVKITHPEMKRYFMTAPEACLLVMQAGALGRGGEVFVLDMGSPIKIVDLAREMIRFSGLEPDKDIPIVFTEPRPGEKFFEEILTAEEGTAATQNQKIFMARLLPVERDRLKSALEKLKESANMDDKVLIKEILKEIIPSYKNGQTI